MTPSDNRATTHADEPTGLPVDDVRRLLDACWKAKAITELMPALPAGIKPRYIHVIDAVWHLNRPNGQQYGTARVGDVSAFLGVTTPSVTKLVGDMADLGLLVKHADQTDRRAVTLTLTGRGLDLRRTYVEEYHAHLSRVLAGITADQCETVVRTLTEALRLMQGDMRARES
ncbi:MarR family transcriptional regulator [Bifidobacterium ramosum]|uniref:MarR family transcriptional regulator n=1 Tax=Bifidobacterium ramosum TaxID=1798158 RepID=A0A6L4WY56_9BIFI|nr:MarR family winged helix-turn-helix transcriptional regulator [Bifidobacterium ramosum]KAB8287016.1 MarR family transcriptional regulator [Bifidobacterium ramosum]NEG72477.1 MarR family transcriptional regulator [Bifidobacterium ramosum]